MDPQQQLDPNGVPPATKTWHDLLALIVRWKRFIALLTLVATIVAIIVSLLMPNWYKSTSSILPPQEASGTNALGSAGSLLRSIASGGRLGSLLPQSGFYNYLAILKSRSAMEEVVRRFDLFKIYAIPDTLMDRAVKELTDHVEFEVEPEEYFTISVYDRDRQRAADMANSLVDILNRISIKLATQNAKSNREFLEQRVGIIKGSLAEKEDSLKSFQKKSGTLMLLEEGAQGLGAVVDLYAMKEQKEIELGILQRTVAADNSLMRQKQIELEELKKRIATIPETGIQSLRLYRDVMIEQRILEFVIPLYEQAKIDEQKDVPVLLVLDRAVPTERKSSPNRPIIVLSTFLASLLASVGWAVVSERYQQMIARRPEVLTNLRALVLWRRKPE